MQYVRNDTTSALWDVYYWVKMPQLQLTSVEYLRTVGSYTTGDRAADRELAGQWITTMCPIHRMVDHHTRGVQIRILNDVDLKPIYVACTAHLSAWASNLTHGINIGGAPIDDLFAIDAFAETIYTFAKYAFPPDVIESMLGQALSKTARFTANTLFRSKPRSQVETDAFGGVRINATSLYPERTSFATEFERFRTIRRL